MSVLSSPRVFSLCVILVFFYSSVSLLLLLKGMLTFALFAGPWFIGEVIDGHSGACFAFGVFVDGYFLEGSLTYVVGIFQVRVLPSH